MKKIYTERELKNTYRKMFKISYCNLQYALDCFNPFGYTSGVNGWKADFYNIGGYIISTGYAPIGSINVPYAVATKYDNKAIKIRNDMIKGKIKKYSTVKRKIEKLIVEMCEELEGVN